MSVESAFPTPPSYYKRYAKWLGEDSKETDEALRPPKPIPLDQEPLVLFGALAYPHYDEKEKPQINGGPKQQLYSSDPSLDIVAELRKLNRSLLLNFLELLDILWKNPSGFQKKVEDLEVILVNMHHLLNYYRPHQARSYLLTVLEDRVRKKQEMVGKMRDMFKKAQAALQQVAQRLEQEAVADKSIEAPAQPAALPSQAEDAAAGAPGAPRPEPDAEPDLAAALLQMKTLLDSIPRPAPMLLAAPSTPAAPAPSTRASAPPAVVAPLPAAPPPRDDEDDGVIVTVRTPSKRKK